MFPATLFDFNGVLADDEHVHCAAFGDTLAPWGITLSEEDYWEKYLGFDDAGAFEAILKDNGREASAATVRELVEAKRPHYMRRARAELRTFPGAAELIRARHQVGPVAIVSGALTQEIEFGLEFLGVSECVPKIISAEDTQVSKPDPEGYQMGIDWLRTQGVTQPERALVIEDSPAGIAAARAAGLPVIALAHSYSVEELQKTTEASLVLSRLAEITEEVLVSLYRRLYE